MILDTRRVILTRIVGNRILALVFFRMHVEACDQNLSIGVLRNLKFEPGKTKRLGPHRLENGH